MSALSMIVGVSQSYELRNAHPDGKGGLDA